MMPAGAVADEAIVLAGDELRLVSLDGRRRRVGNLGGLPLADVDLAPATEDGTVLARGPVAIEQFQRTVDEWMVLTAAQLVGATARALELAVDYVKERRAWGQPVGSFQAVAHTLADAATATDGARLLTLQAAWAASVDPPEHRAAELAAMAFAFAYQTARDVTYHALHYHGGYGFSMEYDLQLYYRRCRAWGLVWGDPSGAFQRVADARYGPIGAHANAGTANTGTAAPAPAKPAPATPAPTGLMDFRLGGRSDALRGEVRAFLEREMTPELEERVYRTGVSHDARFTEALREEGWLAPGWPDEAGGQARDPIELLALSEELSRAHAPTYGIGTTVMVARILRAMGTQQQRDDILPRALRGEIVIALGFSEPESGSDVAAARCRAVRDGDEWVINGQKMFTTNGHIADYVFLLTRTDPDLPKHQGLTTFLVPMDQAGVEAQAVYTLSGERTNITYYSDVRVPDSLRVGDVNGGWTAMTATLRDEHAAAFAGGCQALLDDAEAWARADPDPAGKPGDPAGDPASPDPAAGNGRRPIDDPHVRGQLARAAVDTEVSFLLQRRSAWMDTEGLGGEAEGPMAKLFSSEAIVRNSQALTELLGADGLRSYFEPTAPRNGRIEHTLRYALGTTTYAGTSEVQRNIIAERGLGLPRPTRPPRATEPRATDPGPPSPGPPTRHDELPLTRRRRSTPGAAAWPGCRG